MIRKDVVRWVLAGTLLISQSSTAKQTLDNWRICPLDTSTAECTPITAGTDLHKAIINFSGKAIYQTQFKGTDECFQSSSCWLFLGELADSGSIRLNGRLIANFAKPTFSYIRSNSLLLPLPELEKPGEIFLEVEAYDLNQTLAGLRSQEAVIGNYAELRWRQNTDWLIRTGSSLMSSFALTIMLIGSLGAFAASRRRPALALAIYAGISAVYHISFSELTRDIINPIAASGPIHFGLRLAQDLALFWLLSVLLKTQQKPKTERIITILYPCAILTLTVSWFAGQQDYQFYQRLMYLFAPLVAFPAFYGLSLAVRLHDDFERKVSSAFLSAICVFQANDLLVFWQVYRGTFFVRWYPAFIVIFLGCIYLRRKTLARARLERESAIGKLVAQVSHDIRSPIIALKTAYQMLEPETDELRQLVQSATEKIQRIAEGVLAHARTPSPQELRPIDIPANLRKTIREKQLEFKDRSEVTISLTVAEPDTECFALVDSTELQRVVSNLINNAIEAIAGSGAVTIDLSVTTEKVTIEIRDTGKGFPEPILLNFGRRGDTSKINGNGLGLSHAKECIRSWNGRFHIQSTPGLGSVVAIVLPRTSGFRPSHNIRTVGARLGRR